MKSKSWAWTVLIALSVVWGSSFILMKRGLEAFSSDEVAAIRISIAFVFLAPLLFRHSGIDFRKYWKGLVIMGVFGNLIPAFLFTYAETEISSSLTGMLNALTPLFTILVGLFWLQVRPTALKVAGIVVGLVGAMALMYFETNNAPSKNALFGLLVVLATACYAISINGIKKYLNDLSSVAATVWAFAFIGPFALIYLFGFSNFMYHAQTSPQALNAMGYLSILAIVGTALSVMVYNRLIREAGAVFASTCTYLIPLVAIGWGLIDCEVISWQQGLSMLVIILSVYLINRR
jgi:drug/metabolite transporter (DMT)-like permease